MVFGLKLQVLGVGTWGAMVRRVLPAIATRQPESPPVRHTVQAAAGMASLKGNADPSVHMALLLKTQSLPPPPPQGGHLTEFGTRIVRHYVALPS